MIRLRFSFLTRCLYEQHGTASLLHVQGRGKLAMALGLGAR